MFNHILIPYQKVKKKKKKHPDSPFLYITMSKKEGFLECKNSQPNRTQKKGED